ncbi:MAG: hypothetical protein ACK5U7_11415 [Bacteroidota bacterium]|jgi:hypothetical protein
MLPAPDAASRLDQLLDYLTETLKSGVDFAGTQIPLLARDIALYGAYSNWAYCLVILLLLLGCFLLFRRCYHVARLPASTEDARFVHGLGCVISTIASIVLIICFFPCLDDAVKATFAPRVYILEYVADLIKPTARTR